MQVLCLGSGDASVHTAQAPLYSNEGSRQIKDISIPAGCALSHVWGARRLQSGRAVTSFLQSWEPEWFVLWVGLGQTESRGRWDTSAGRTMCRCEAVWVVTGLGMSAPGELGFWVSSALSWEPWPELSAIWGIVNISGMNEWMNT